MDAPYIHALPCEILVMILDHKLSVSPQSLDAVSRTCGAFNAAASLTKMAKCKYLRKCCERMQYFRKLIQFVPDKISLCEVDLANECAYLDIKDKRGKFSFAVNLITSEFTFMEPAKEKKGGGPIHTSRTIAGYCKKINELSPAL